MRTPTTSQPSPAGSPTCRRPVAGRSSRHPPERTAWLWGMCLKPLNPKCFSGSRASHGSRAAESGDPTAPGAASAPPHTPGGLQGSTSFSSLGFERSFSLKRGIRYDFPFLTLLARTPAPQAEQCLCKQRLHGRVELLSHMLLVAVATDSHKARSSSS